jgi:hypothetical protein
VKPGVLVALGTTFLAVDGAAYKCTAMPATGATVFWETRSVPVMVHEACSLDITPTELCIDAVRQALSAWDQVGCSDFSFVDSGLTQDARAGYDWRRPEANQNVVVWREGRADDILDRWVHQSSALAITTVTFSSYSGAILDADVEVNGAPGSSREYTFQICNGPGCTGNDIQNTLTHEAGHMLGLDHPPASEAGASETTMYGSAPLGETGKRSLAQDDENGLCDIYPNGQATQPCVPLGASGLPAISFTQKKLCNDIGSDPCGESSGCPSSGFSGFVMGAVLLGVRRLRLR